MGFPFVCSLILEINSTKIWNNDRHRQGNHQYTTEWTQATHNFALCCLRNHVTISKQRNEQTKQTKLMSPTRWKKKAYVGIWQLYLVHSISSKQCFGKFTKRRKRKERLSNPVCIRCEGSVTLYSVFPTMKIVIHYRIEWSRIVRTVKLREGC